MQNYTFGGKQNIQGTDLEQVFKSSHSTCQTPKTQTCQEYQDPAHTYNPDKEQDLISNLKSEIKKGRLTTAY